MEIRFYLLFILLLVSSFCKAQDQPPNILLIIADDLGVDAINGFQDNPIKPVTPILDSLRENGLTFKNVWAAPVCSPTRAAIMSGKYGIKTGVTGLQSNLNIADQSIFSFLEETYPDTYAKAVMGKWHISSPIDVNHPQQHGVDYFAGSMRGAVSDFYNWNKVVNGSSGNSTNYLTTDLTDESINWINDQSKPWFLWLAHNTPHTPFHTPPEELYTSKPANTNRTQFTAMIESMDAEIGRLISNIPDDQIDNTIIIFIGDNGTAGQVVQNYPSDQAKVSIYQGGVNVPMIISGAGVSRINESESAMIHAIDLYATIIELTGTELPGGIHNSLSFDHLLTGNDGSQRDYNYSEVTMNADANWTIRNERYKYLNFSQGADEFYDLLTDSLETENLINGLTAQQAIILSDLQTEAEKIRTDWSCKDHIKNGQEIGIDCGGNCVPCLTDSASSSENDIAIKIFPNPSTNHIVIQSPTIMLSGYQLMTFSGAKITSAKDLQTNKITLDTSNLEPGTYLIEITTLDNNSLTRQISILH